MLLADLPPSLPEGLADAYSIYADAFAKAIEPDRELTVSQWADERRVISNKGAAESGRYRTSRVPYMREIMDTLSPSHPATEVVLCKGTQMGASEAGFNWLGAIIDLWPAPTLLVNPTMAMGKLTSKQRIQPMIDETPCLSAKVADARSRDSGNTTMLKEFPGGVLRIVGANSGPGLRSMPVRFLMMDEVDAYPDDVQGEGDPCKLAEKRTETFARRKIYRLSTPINKGGRIERYYEASDQRRYHVPCPHCDHTQWLQWDRVRWKQREVRELACIGCGAIHEIETDASQPCPMCHAGPEQQRLTTRETDYVERAWYECEACQQDIDEWHKTTMLERGHWVSHRPGPGRQPGFHLSALYSPLGWFSWRQAVEQYLEAKQDTSGELEKTWTNTVLGIGWEQPGTTIEPALLRGRIDDYRLGTVPDGPLILTASVDTQDTRLEYLVKGWGPGEESWVIDFGAIFGDPAEPYVWAEVEALLSKVYKRADGTEFRISATAIDSGGHFTQAVYLFARKWQRRHVLAVKGASTPGRPILGRPSFVDITHQGKKLTNGAKLWIIGTDTAKAAIYNRLRLDKPGPGFLHFPDGLPDTYYEQLTAEKMVQRFVRGFTRYEWVKNPKTRNEALDLEVYALAAAYYAGISRVNWDKLAHNSRKLEENRAKSDEIKDDLKEVQEQKTQEPRPRLPVPKRANWVTDIYGD